MALSFSCIPSESGSSGWLMAAPSPGSINDSKGCSGHGQATAVGQTCELPHVKTLVCYPSVGTRRRYSHGTGAVGSFRCPDDTNLYPRFAAWCQWGSQSFVRSLRLFVLCSFTVLNRRQATATRLQPPDADSLRTLVVMSWFSEHRRPEDARIIREPCYGFQLRMEIHFPRELLKCAVNPRC